MSKYELRKTIQKELRELNYRIDMKIVRGLSYRQEARRHKFLLMQFDRLSRQAAKGWGLLNGISKMAGSLSSSIASFML